MAEQRQFRVDPNLIFDVISKQTGQVSKAALEGVMNAIDSGSTRCDVEFTSTGYVIADDGRGFGNRQSIEDFFEVFGKPHVKGDAVMGRFRIGRGQGFSYGVNHWRSGIFTMEVDLKTRGLDYTLTETPDDVHAGCRVEVRFYEPLSPNELDTALRDIKEMITYCPIPVYINGEKAVKDRSKVKWDVQNDDCLIAFNSNSTTLKVYNLGIFVRSYRAGQSGGAGGVVVSKKQLEVNFARNDILHSACDVWKRIRRELDRLGRDRGTKPTNRMTADEREFQIQHFLHDDLPVRDFENLKVFPQFPSGYVSLYTILRKCTLMPEHLRIPLVVMQEGDNDRVAEVVQREERAVLLRGQVLDWANLGTAEQLVEGLVRAVRRKMTHGYDYQIRHLQALPLSKVSDGIKGNSRPIPRKDWTPLEVAVMTSITDSVYPILRTLNKDSGAETNIRQREHRIGESDSALAWTDGRSYVCFDRKFVADRIQSLAGIHELLGTTVHEYLHDTDDAGSHVHDSEFFERFHDVMLGGSMNSMAKFLNRFTRACNTTKAKMPRGLRNDLTKIFRLSRADGDAEGEDAAAGGEPAEG